MQMEMVIIIMGYQIIKNKNHIMISELLKLKSSNLKILLIKRINILKKMTLKRVKYFLSKELTTINIFIIK